jgi:site-specific DNA-methyltransferase (adenine-specific)
MLTPFYQDELVRLYCGKCESILPQLEQKSVDLIVTDPPYFSPVQSYVGTRECGYKRRTLADLSIIETYFEVVVAIAHGVLKQSGTAYWFCDGQTYPGVHHAMYPYYKYVRPLIWDKIVSYNGYTWRHQHELIAWGEGFEAERVPTGDGDILKRRGVLQDDRLHPAEKPTSLLCDLIKKHDAGAIVLDPYAGSGATLVAAKSLGRKSIGVEFDKTYCQNIVDRLSKVEPLFEREAEQTELPLAATGI